MAAAVASTGTVSAGKPAVAIPTPTGPSLPAVNGAAGQSGASTPVQAWSGATPTFQQVLAAPDDAALNIAYAHDQAGKGHLLAAAAAFERILLEQPDNDTVRLMYIDILLRLDDVTGAAREVAKLNPITLTDADRATLVTLTGRLTAMQPNVPAASSAGVGVTP